MVALQQAHLDAIELRCVQVPQLDFAEIVEVKRAWRVSVVSAGRQLLRCLLQQLVAVVERGFQAHSIFNGFAGARHKALHIERRVIGENVFGLGKNIINGGLRDDTQRYFSVDAAEGEVVDQIAEGRDVRALSGIDFHYENVVAVEVNVAGEFKGEGGIAALVFTQAHAIEPDGGGGHHSFKVDEDTLAAGGGG